MAPERSISSVADAMHNGEYAMKTEKKSGTDPMRRILAWIGIILLLAMYVVTFVAAIFSSPSTNGLFLASLTMTFVIPAAIYVFQWIRKVTKKEE